MGLERAMVLESKDVKETQDSKDIEAARPMSNVQILLQLDAELNARHKNFNRNCTIFFSITFVASLTTLGWSIYLSDKSLKRYHANKVDYDESSCAMSYPSTDYCGPEFHEGALNKTVVASFVPSLNAETQNSNSTKKYCYCGFYPEISSIDCRDKLSKICDGIFDDLGPMFGALVGLSASIFGKSLLYSCCYQETLFEKDAPEHKDIMTALQANHKKLYEQIASGHVQTYQNIHKSVGEELKPEEQKELAKEKAERNRGCLSRLFARWRTPSEAHRPLLDNAESPRHESKGP